MRTLMATMGFFLHHNEVGVLSFNGDYIKLNSQNLKE
jgi:hypothetical protein